MEEAGTVEVKRGRRNEMNETKGTFLRKLLGAG